MDQKQALACIKILGGCRNAQSRWPRSSFSFILGNQSLISAARKAFWSTRCAIITKWRPMDLISAAMRSKIANPRRGSIVSVRIVSGGSRPSMLFLSRIRSSISAITLSIACLRPWHAARRPFLSFPLETISVIESQSMKKTRPILSRKTRLGGRIVSRQPVSSSNTLAIICRILRKTGRSTQRAMDTISFMESENAAYRRAFQKLLRRRK